jgi:hypothetical protein
MALFVQLARSREAVGGAATISQTKAWIRAFVKREPMQNAGLKSNWEM